MKASDYSLSDLHRLASAMDPYAVNSRTVTVDWGSTQAAGKRSGGMVRGSMSDAPKGVKSYRTIEWPDTDLTGLDSYQREAYSQYRQIGLSDNEAWLLAENPITGHAYLVAKAVSA